MKNPERSAIQILCDEIGADYFKEFEGMQVLVSFVSVLVDEIGDKMETDRIIAHLTGINTSVKAGECLNIVKSLLLITDENKMIDECAKAHLTVTVHDPSPCDHYVDMLSSCVSALRFGLEKPCQSRHAAEAASHIWKHKYNIGLFDEHSSRWQKDYSNAMLKKAIARLI